MIVASPLPMVASLLGQVSLELIKTNPICRLDKV